jgi:TolB protein
MTVEGKLETALINQEDFRKNNCFNPAVSSDGVRVLFVSDQGVDDQGRHHNDIYMVNADGTNLQRLTQNPSDNIMPAWSPSEEGVIFFLSNRGGAYNIWRLKLNTGSK